MSAAAGVADRHLERFPEIRSLCSRRSVAAGDHAEGARNSIADAINQVSAAGFDEVAAAEAVRHMVLAYLYIRPKKGGGNGG